MKRRFGVPGAKLVFMGGELAQVREWDHDGSVSWELLDDPAHAGVAAWVTALNALYRRSASLVDDAGSFQWLGLGDAEKSVVTWARSRYCSTACSALMAGSAGRP